MLTPPVPSMLLSESAQAPFSKLCSHTPPPVQPTTAVSSDAALTDTLSQAPSTGAALKVSFGVVCPRSTQLPLAAQVVPSPASHAVNTAPLLAIGSAVGTSSTLACASCVTDQAPSRA